MKTELHKHNPEILKVLEGCGEELMFDGDVQLCCGKSINFIEQKIKVPVDQYENIILCESCKRIIKGILIAQEKEIEFLEMFYGRNFDNLKQLNPSRFEEDKLYNQGMDDICKEQNKVLSKRLQELKISNEDFREKVK